jgi:hypothetical protein
MTGTSDLGVEGLDMLLSDTRRLIDTMRTSAPPDAGEPPQGVGTAMDGAVRCIHARRMGDKKKIGQNIGGHVLTEQEFYDTVNKYLYAAEAFARESGVTALSLKGSFRVNATPSVGAFAER